MITERTIVARVFALGTGAVVRVAADSTDVVVGHVPAPGRDGIPFFDGDLHRVAAAHPLTRSNRERGVNGYYRC